LMNCLRLRDIVDSSLFVLRLGLILFRFR
jgi:hypothetical protein